MNKFEKIFQNSIRYWESFDILIGDRIIEKKAFTKQISYGKSKFDFWILYESKFFAIELKSRSQNRLYLKGLPEHQIDNLLEISISGGEGLICILFIKKNKVFCQPIEKMLGKVSVSFKECEKDWILVNFIEKEILNLPSILQQFMKGDNLVF